MSNDQDITPLPWSYRDSSGAGLEILAPVYQMSGVELPKGMPDQPIKIFEFTAPQVVQIAFERWVQFEPTGWGEMQKANAAYIVKACNSYPAMKAALEEALPFLELLHSLQPAKSDARKTVLKVVQSTRAALGLQG